MKEQHINHMQQQKLNISPIMDYEKVEKLKWAFFQEIFNQEGEKILNSKEFIFFFNKNKEWLVPYSPSILIKETLEVSHLNHT